MQTAFPWPWRVPNAWGVRSSIGPDPVATYVNAEYFVTLRPVGFVTLRSAVPGDPGGISALRPMQRDEPSHPVVTTCVDASHPALGSRISTLAPGMKSWPAIHTKRFRWDQPELG